MLKILSTKKEINEIGNQREFLKLGLNRLVLSNAEYKTSKSGGVKYLSLAFSPKDDFTKYRSYNIFEGGERFYDPKKHKMTREQFTENVQQRIMDTFCTLIFCHSPKYLEKDAAFRKKLEEMQGGTFSTDKMLEKGEELFKILAEKNKTNPVEITVYCHYQLKLQDTMDRTFLEIDNGFNKTFSDMPCEGYEMRITDKEVYFINDLNERHEISRSGDYMGLKGHLNRQERGRVNVQKSADLNKASSSAWINDEPTYTTCSPEPFTINENTSGAFKSFGEETEDMPF